MTKSRDLTITSLNAAPKRRHQKKTVKSSVSKYALDPFYSSGSDGQPEFGRETGYRSREIPGLVTGPYTTNIINGYVARKRSRYAVLSNPHAKRAVDILVSNVVGAGHRMVSTCQNEVFKDQVEKAWTKWCKQCDTTGQLPFGGLEALAFRSAIEGGDSFVRMRNRRPEDNLVVPLQLQVLESEQVPLEKNEFVGKQRIVAGIQYDILGKPVFYHMYRNHPGDYLALINDPVSIGETVPVPAADVLHLHEIRRPLDGRGLPFLAQMVIRLNDLDRYMDAELVRKKAVALIGGFIRTPQDGAMDNPFLTDRDEENLQDVEIEALEPGSFPVLPPGYEVSFSQPADVGQNFQVFLKQQLLTIAMSMNITYEQLSGDLRDVNDRTLRASMLEFKRFCINLQDHILVHQFCEPVFQRWFTTAILAGTLVIPAGLDEEEARGVRWIPDPWDYLNPVQDIQAEKEAIKAGLKTYDDAIMERGGVPQEYERTIAATKKRQEALGLKFDTDTSAAAPAPAPNTPTRNEPDAIANEENNDDDGQVNDPEEPKQEP